MEVFLFPKVVPNLWNVDGEVTVPEQKPGEVAEELASSYERKLLLKKKKRKNHNY